MPLVRSRNAVLVRAPDPRWRELFEDADVVSEGSLRDERVGRVWYGSTSLILRTAAAEGSPGVAGVAGAAGVPSGALLAALAERDVHVRLRAVRMAHREACLRAPGRLGRFTCEMRVSADAEGVRIDVDVQAPLIEGRARTRSAR
jgi:hypothetical protein